jgi:hypothetical protein
VLTDLDLGTLTWSLRSGASSPCPPFLYTPCGCFTCENGLLARVHLPSILTQSF